METRRSKSQLLKLGTLGCRGKEEFFFFDFETWESLQGESHAGLTIEPQVLGVEEKNDEERWSKDP